MLQIMAGPLWKIKTNKNIINFEYGTRISEQIKNKNKNKEKLLVKPFFYNLQISKFHTYSSSSLKKKKK